MIDRRHVLIFVTKKNSQKLHRYDQIAVGGVFEV